MQHNDTSLCSHAVEVSMLRMLRDSGAISEEEYRGICKVAARYTGSDLFLLC